MRNNDFGYRYVPGSSVPISFGFPFAAEGSLGDECLAAVRIGNAAWLMKLVQQDEQLTTYRDALGNTALHVACLHGHVHVVDFFVRRQPSLLAELNGQGHIPLHEAVIHGCDEVVEYLVERHPETANIKDRTGRDAKELAKLFGHETIMRILNYG